MRPKENKNKRLRKKQAVTSTWTTTNRECSDPVFVVHSTWFFIPQFHPFFICVRAVCADGRMCMSVVKCWCLAVACVRVLCLCTAFFKFVLLTLFCPLQKRSYPQSFYCIWIHSALPSLSYCPFDMCSCVRVKIFLTLGCLCELSIRILKINCSTDSYMHLILHMDHANAYNDEYAIRHRNATWSQFIFVSFNCSTVYTQILCA